VRRVALRAKSNRLYPLRTSAMTGGAPKYFLMLSRAPARAAIKEAADQEA
jgi:hypothetical protein